MFISKNRWIAFTLFVLASYGLVAQAENVKTTLSATDVGKIYFNSAEKDVTYGQIYKHTAVLDMPITGELRFPPNMTATDKVPVMVLMHGSGGINKGTYAWVDYFNSLGVATFVIDSFNPRGFDRTYDKQDLMTPATSSADALLALKLLATHPRIDSSRIGIIGYSKGAMAAINSSFEKLRSAMVPGNLKYALHIPLYPLCNQVGTTTGSPILLLIGSEDTATSPVACHAEADELRRLGADIKYVEYAGALHGFDNGYPHVYIARAQSFRKCAFLADFDRMEAHIEGSNQVATAAEVRDYAKSCMKLGYSTGSDSSATSKARIEVKEFITKNFAIGQTLGQ